MKIYNGYNMKRIYFILATVAIAALYGCSNETIGESPTVEPADSNLPAITFGCRAGNLTRGVTSNTGTDAEKLGGEFKVFGVKQDEEVATDYYTVFKNYKVWSITDTEGTKWDYVGYSPDDITHSASRQYAKYWDYSAPHYHFVAGAPAANFTYATDANGDITSATVSGIGGHINANPVSGEGTALSHNPVYIADPVIVSKPTGYNNDVTFSFTRQQTFVRVGIYETIPGYTINDIKFYPYDETANAWGTTGSNNIVLTSRTANYFTGSADATAQINYIWTGAGAPKYEYTYSSTSLTQQKNWYGGALATGVPAVSSSVTSETIASLFGTDKDMDANGYFTVIPTSSAVTAQPILVKCDYTLYSEDDSEEVIKVKGATAVIPAAFTFWKANNSYTYLFKITKDTNGTTGIEGQDPEGLYPITFAAVVVAPEDGMQGTITTVSTPNITTYQAGSVTDTGIRYVKDKAITVIVTDNTTGAVKAINGTTAGIGYVQVYALGTDAKTEADLQVSRPTTGAVAVSITDNKLTFTPTAAGYYAIEYQTAESPAAYTYKVIHIEN